MPEGTHSSTKISDSLDAFLFVQIAQNPEYIQWTHEYQIPGYITDNLAPNKPMRDYQIEAVKRFIWLFESGNRQAAQHLLFNMATGTGKTLVMTACVLYLYEQGYRNFIFLVHRDQILKQAKKNFTDYTFEKYLFNARGITFNGRKVQVRAIARLQDATPHDINFLFISTSLLFNRLKEDQENSLTLEDFKQNDVVIIADEAHSLNVETRKAITNEAEREQKNWESTVMSALTARPQNMLLEFTATVDFANKNIHTKYTDKILYKYDFIQFNSDGYSKDVAFLFNDETQIEDQKKQLIINALALSEYRKLLFRRVMNVAVNPVILVKSKKISDSELDRKYFDSIVASLRPSDFARLEQLSYEQDKNGIITGMFAWLRNNRTTLEEFTSDIKQAFAHSNTLIYNSKQKENPELMAQLDDPRSTIRAIFSVNALNEGWDVLSLYDIIHFDISESKKVSLQDIQLIGRGARYCPYELPANFTAGNTAGLFGNFELDPFKRKFDQTPEETGRVLETFYYHFVKTGTFLDKLQAELMGEGIMHEGVEKKVITMKSSFIESDTYKHGFVLVNTTVKRAKTTEDEIEATFNKVLHIRPYTLHARALSDREQNERQATMRHTENNLFVDFSDEIIKKALMTAENGFFRYGNLIEHIPGLLSIDEFMNRYLKLVNLRYEYIKGKELDSLTPYERLQLLTNDILPEIRKNIDVHMPKLKGSTDFRPLSLNRVFERQKAVYLTAFAHEDTENGTKVFISPDERAKPQTNHLNPDLRLNIAEASWYAYDENYGTSEEKKFVKFVSTYISGLETKYPGSEIYLIRNELDYWIFNPADGRRFSPDYLLFINDHTTKKLYYQCIFEVKGGHIIEKDAWKEEALLAITRNLHPSFETEEYAEKLSGGKKAYQAYLDQIQQDGYQEIINLGFKFYNTDPREESEFASDFETKLEI
jgi:type III restriction enzyme